jgi:hypothetical protein
VNARETIELAIAIAREAALPCGEPSAFSHEPIATPSSILDYWRGSVIRFGHWRRALHTRADKRDELAALVEEILSAEILARVWGARLAATESASASARFVDVAATVLAHHVDLRRAALELLCDPKLIRPHDAMSLDRLRRRAERWSDLLVGQWAIVADVSHWAPRPQRARQIAAEHAPGGPLEEQPPWKIVAAALRASYRPVPRVLSPNAKLNARIAAAVAPPWLAVIC